MPSRTPGPFRFDPFAKLVDCATPGTLGRNDFADPAFWLRSAYCRLMGDTPGSVGKNDRGQPQVTPPIVQKAPIQTVTGPLEVSRGQVTFNAEGNDNAGSIGFTRHIHWPRTPESGVTLGRGYDMGSRTEAAVAADLVAAGLDDASAKAFAKGAGKKGEDAKKFVADNQQTLGNISQEVQKKLFQNIYPTYVTRARSNYEKWTSKDPDVAERVPWDELSPAIRDILVDFVYQGFTKGPNPMVKGMRNDFDELIKYIEGSPVLTKYEKGRRRVDYLKAHRHNSIGSPPML